MTAFLPVVALIGRPNVGKSTLFNRLTRSRDALVADLPGLTRDRQYGRGRVGPIPYILVDTGGFEPAIKEGVTALMARQTRQALVEADRVLFIVDARDGLTPHDQEIAEELRRQGDKIVLVVNKAEGKPADIVAADFHALGFGEPVIISAAHGDNVSAMIDYVLEPFVESGAAVIGAEGAAGGTRSGPTDTADHPGDEADRDEVAGADDRDDGEDGEDGEVDLADDRAEADIDGGTPDRAAAGAGDDRSTGAPGRTDWRRDRSTETVRIAVVGRPNAGKSTLINALLGEERLVAFDLPGTTRDAVIVPFERAGRRYELVDTAGVRRRARVTEAIEKFSVIKAIQAIEASNVCVLLLDAGEGIAEQDTRLAGYVLEAGRALVVAINKWDLVDSGGREWLKKEFERRFHFLSFARILHVSALRGQGLGAILKAADLAWEAAVRPLSTPRLTRTLRDAVTRQQPPLKGRIRPKLRYAHQGGQNPPVIVVHGSALEHVPDSYRRYLEGVFRREFDLAGTPMRIEFRSGRNPYAPAQRKG